MSSESPVNSVPFVALLFGLIIIGAEATFSLADLGLIGGQNAVGWRINMWERTSFDPTTIERVFMLGDYNIERLKTFFTYFLVNHGFGQAAFSAALALALGKAIGDAFGNLALLVIILLTSFVGALAYGIVFPDGSALSGSFTPVFGLIGAYTYMLWLRLGEAGQKQLQAFRLVAVLLSLQALFSVVVLLTGQAANGWPVWVPELAGCAAGFGVSVLLAPGGWTSFVSRMRQRS